MDKKENNSDGKLMLMIVALSITVVGSILRFNMLTLAGAILLIKSV